MRLFGGADRYDGADKYDASQEEVKALTNQFYVTMRAYVARLDKEDEERSPKAFAQVQELLAKDRKQAWNDAYQIEQLLVDLYDERTLDVELQNRLLEAESNLRPALAALYTRQAALVKTPAERRALLARLVNDLQWRYTVNEVKRTYAKEITRTTGKIFIAVICAFAAGMLLHAQIKTILDRALAYGESTLFLLAFLAGAWGAAFSMLASLRRRLDASELNDLKLMKSGWILWSRPMIGAAAASILYFFLISQLLAGSAFPDFRTDGQVANTGQNPAVSVEPGAPQTSSPAGTQSAPPTTPETRAANPQIPPVTPQTQWSARHLALLVVWCFIAGFSEQLVPGLLAKTEGRANGQSQLGPERFQPALDRSEHDGERADAAGARQQRLETGELERVAPPSGARSPAEPPKTA